VLTRDEFESLLAVQADILAEFDCLQLVYENAPSCDTVTATDNTYTTDNTYAQGAESALDLQAYPVTVPGDPDCLQLASDNAPNCDTATSTGNACTTDDQEPESAVFLQSYPVTTPAIHRKRRRLQLNV
jgi:hypothetical protein